MPLNLKELSSKTFNQSISWDERDVIIYAIATGHTHKGINRENLDLVYEKNLRVLPPFCTVLARNASPTLKDLGGDYTKVVLASTESRFLLPLPVAGSADATTKIISVADKGESKGAIITMETRLSIVQEDYAIILTQQMARGDGGCGDFSSGSDKTLSRGSKPIRSPDHSISLTTRTDQAALYRLLGDHNPLHIDADAAKASGFHTPIMHGLCTYGIAFQALNSVSPKLFDTFSIRFSAPVYPGEPLELNLWQEEEHHYFELLATARDQSVTVSGVAR